jgi:hypothetical protein
MAVAGHCNAAAARACLHPLLPLLGQVLDTMKADLQGAPLHAKVGRTSLWLQVFCTRWCFPVQLLIHWKLPCTVGCRCYAAVFPCGRRFIFCCDSLAGQSRSQPCASIHTDD